MATRLENHEMRAVTSLSGDFWRHDTVGDWVWSGIFAPSLLLMYTNTGLSIWTIAVGVVWLVGLYRTMNTRLYQAILDGAWNIGLFVFRKGNLNVSKFISMSEIVDIVHDDGKSEALVPIGNDGTVAIVLKGDGSDMATSEPEQIKKRLEAFGRSLTTTQGVGISFVYANRPVDTWGLADSFDQNMHPLVAIPPRRWENYPQPETVRYNNLHTISVEQQWTLAQIARDTSHFVVITIPRDKMKSSQRIQAMQGSITRQALRRHPAVHLGNLIRVKLKSVGLQSHVANALEVATLARLAWDSNMRSMHDAVHLDEAAALDNAVHLPPPKGKAHHDHLEVDGNFIAFLRITDIPEIVTPNWTNALRGVRNVEGRFVSLNSCLIGTAVSARSERWILSRLIPIRDAILSWVGGSYRSPEAMERQEQDLGRSEELMRGNYRRFDAIPFIEVFGTSYEDLQDNLAAVHDTMDGIDMGSKQIKGARQQLRALRSASGLNHL